MEDAERKKEMEEIADLAQEYILRCAKFITGSPNHPQATNFSEAMGFAVGILVDTGKEVNEQMMGFNRGIGQIE